MNKGFGFTALLLAMALCVTLLAGCGNTDTNSDSTSDTSSGTSSGDTTDTSSTSGSTDKTQSTDDSTDETPSTDTSADKTQSTDTETSTADTDNSEAEVSSVNSDPATENSEGSGAQECAHSYSAWTTVKEATCEAEGAKKRECTKCGIAQQDILPPKGHVWDEGEMTTVPTTCGDMGVCRYTCTVCGATKTKQISGTHTFGEWEYEEYQYTITYKPGDPGYSPGFSTSVKTSHRKIRKCTKCSYVERGNTPDHSCTRRCRNHTQTTLKEGTCTTPALMRSTCTICGWYEDYDGAYGKHKWQDEYRHLTDYTEYTNELDAQVSVCTACGFKTVIYTRGKGYDDNNKYYVNHGVSPGKAYMGYPINDDIRALEHPEWQMTLRSFFYDQNGYVIRYTVYWWYNGQRYSQVINCGPGEIEAWFKEYGLVDTSGRGHYSPKIFGTYIAPDRIAWTG